MVATNVKANRNIQNTSASKLEQLRILMVDNNLDCYLIPAVDEHLNLSVPAAKQRRAWISGFTGSAGDLLVGKDAAWLFVDSRYYEQAELQVDAALIKISKLGLEGNLSLIETLEKIAVESAQKSTKIRFGFDPFTVATEQYQNWVRKFATAGIELVAISENLADKVRETAEILPAIDESPIFSLPVSLTGETAAQKLARVREAMQKANIDVLPISNLNQIAWLFNLRGSDIPHIPIFISYAIVTADAAFLFTNRDRVSPEIKKELSAAVTLLPYADYPSILESFCVNLSNKVRVLLDSKHSTAGTYQLVLGGQKAENKIEIVFAANPVEGMKARKNPVEIEQMKSANFKASRAKVLTLKWLTEQLENGNVLTEFDVKESIESFYQQETDFQTLTFKTIAGAGANSSIVHYGTPSPEITLKPQELLLLDSGAQYLAGTTDDTRTMIVGEPTTQQIEHYTTVLIAHINCAMQQFPKGTTGSQLDAIARAVLWQQQLDYGHGTGHGVGAFLAGHEGPNGISKFVQYPLEPGMVTSIEPGYYEPGWGGIRLENLYVVREMPSKNGTAWYGFEPLTYIPFEQKLINVDRLSTTQLQWLNNYHTSVVEKLSPVFDATTIAWLKKACAAS
ncbi:aminopeptidase P family protein [Microcoleus sp. LEGE 07076]|uniref:aminopeptidase P family protein n=1 Tax=Microcoleus sp. LEGE 07076 TaxID=915322 RepID=UPI00187E438C|nr:aminopeptidase P family protein [Microcoleus sp. LEGE 07076]MBE9185053.1 aminopeptidase P family protein [Microcoleus sp. LEGE 07076]